MDEIHERIRELDEETVGGPPMPVDWERAETPVDLETLLDRVDGDWEGLLIDAGVLNAGHRAGRPGVLELLEAVEESRKALELDRHPTLFEVVDHAGIDAEEFLLVFDTWFHVLEGVDGESELTAEDVPAEELVRDAERVTRKLGTAPDEERLEEWGGYPSATYRRNVGEIDDLYVEMDEELLPTKAELAREVRRLADQLGGAPNVVQLDKHGEYPYRIYFLHWDTWTDIIEDLGLER